MLTAASPHPLDFDETIHALRYAANAKKILIEPKRYNNYTSEAERKREEQRAKEREAARADRAEAAREFKAAAAAASDAAAAHKRGHRTASASATKRRAEKTVERLDVEAHSPPHASGAAASGEDWSLVDGSAEADDAHTANANGGLTDVQDLEVDALLDQMYELKQELVASERRRAQIELQTREEVTSEMEQNIKQVEEVGVCCHSLL